MLVNIVRFPTVKPGQDAAFLDWFRWSNEQYARHPGFIRRLLLRPRDGGGSAAFVEHESYETFMAMHTGPTQAEAHRRVEPLLEGSPVPEFFEVALE
ncbi:MAG TPA: antibiotic biosynthesis monooxygenase [Chloroflexota bacterium]|nr:antibiotic biosynthesis monooxygenase [Chloroflexota bacterium]